MARRSFTLWGFSGISSKQDDEPLEKSIRLEHVMHKAIKTMVVRDLCTVLFH
jgi:hypothetical protein